MKAADFVGSDWLLVWEEGEGEKQNKNKNRVLDTIFWPCIHLGRKEEGSFFFQTHSVQGKWEKREHSESSLLHKVVLPSHSLRRERGREGRLKFCTKC